MPDIDQVLRLQIYAAFAATGSAPDLADLADDHGWRPDDVRSALRRLAEQRHVVVDPSGAIVLAHPFSAVPLGFSVMGGSTLWWGGCAWDSFAIPHLVTADPDVLVATRCPACDAALSWVVRRDEPPPGDQVAHFLVPVGRMWDDVVFTCGNQRLFCSSECVDRWLRSTGQPRGYQLDLGTLWRLARHWYDGRLDYDYTRREPAAATEYFRSVGLEGPFWEL